MESAYNNNNNYSSLPSKPTKYESTNRRRSAEMAKIKETSINSTYPSTSYYQSTPKPKSTTSSPSALLNGSLARPSGSGRQSASPIHKKSLSPTKLHFSTSSVSPRQLLDVDTDTIQKQRRELQLLILELKDRDRELNDMVQTHQKHLHSWDEDRQRILSLERRCARLEGELKTRNEQFKSLSSRLKASEAQETSRQKELNTTMERLREATEQADMATQRLDDLEDKNTNLSDSLRELSTNFGQLQAKEQELLTKLKLKDNDITEANIRLGEFQQKTRRLESALQEYQTLENSLRSERDQLRDQLNATKNEVETLRGEMSKQFSDTDDLQSELAQAKQDYLVLQKEAFLAGEREKRKDQLLELQKSKQERTDAELQNLRQICERQQRDISYMQMHLQSTQDAFLKAETINNDDRDLNKSGSTPPDWLDMAINVNEEIKDYMPSAPTLLNASSHSQPLSSTKVAAGDLAHDLTTLSLGTPDYHTPLVNFTDTNHQGNGIFGQNNNFGNSSLLLGDSEQFLELPPPSTNPFETQELLGSFVPNNVPKIQENTEENLSPTSKLHQLLAESRQMVNSLEFTTIKSQNMNEEAINETQLSPKSESTSSNAHSLE